ncbi:hypothetical protein E4P40_04335 [Blastococcus sp. CT_GayMR20]|nr:hypothetical protein E4P40_04060 [Blastococcus sp. CT_GayMR20]TFV91996.1 hypothetical protein E4P40_04335 [Blastococcus sp. CT_GayMR20]
MLGPVLLTGCIRVASLGSDLVACKEGDEGTPANGVVLMAQSVPSAAWVPCLEGMPLGWHFADMEADSDSAAFWLDSDRHGVHAIEVQLTESCDTSGASEIPSDRQDMRRMERVTQVSPLFVGRRFYLFEGGCITVLFSISGEDRSEPLAIATQGLGTVSRDDLRELVREESDGRLELDP